MKIIVREILSTIEMKSFTPTKKLFTLSFGVYEVVDTNGT